MLIVLLSPSFRIRLAQFDLFATVFGCGYKLALVEGQLATEEDEAGELELQ